MHGWGLDEFASPDTVRIAVDDCSLLGRHGLILVDDASYPAYVVDCSNARHATLESRGIVADVSAKELGHREASILLWNYE